MHVKLNIYKSSKISWILGQAFVLSGLGIWFLKHRSEEKLFSDFLPSGILAIYSWRSTIVNYINFIKKHLAVFLSLLLMDLFHLKGRAIDREKRKSFIHWSK